MAGGRSRRPAFFAGLAALVLFVASCSSGDSGQGVVPFEADDGTVLRGELFSSSSPAVAAVFVHDFDSGRGVWETLAKTLSARGFLVLAYDMRGHGASPGRKEAGISDADATAALRFMRSSLQQQQVFLVGEGLGAVAVLKAASREQVVGVVSVSAPRSFRGLSAVTDIARIEAPKLFIAAEGDENAAEVAREFQRRGAEPSELALFPGDKAGSDLLEGREGQAARDRVLEFFDSYRPQ